MNKFSTALFDWFFVLDQNEDGAKIVPEELKEETSHVIGFLSIVILVAVSACTTVFIN